MLDWSITKRREKPEPRNLAFFSVVITMSEKDVPVSVTQRIIIRFLVKDNVKFAEIHRKILEQFGDECLSKTQVYKWCSAFRKGCKVVANLRHARRPKTSVTDENKKLCISVTSIKQIIHERLGYRKILARWVPRLPILRRNSHAG